MKILTIKSVKPMGEYSEQYGQTFWGYVEEYEMPVRFSKKLRAIADGTIISAESGAVKEGSKGQYMQLSGINIGGAVHGQTNFTEAYTTPPKKTYVDNSDGQRQGMCINNAANFINATEGPMKPSEWAKKVHDYAAALYTLGDLTNSGSQGAATSHSETKAEKSGPAAAWKPDNVVEDFDVDESIGFKEELNAIGF